MTKELSIETIKEELINKLMNDEEILKYLNVDEWKKEAMPSQESASIRDVLIFDRFNRGLEDNYICVEVNEYDKVNTVNVGEYTYAVMIIFDVHYPNRKNLDKLGASIKRIITDTYGLNKDRDYENVAYANGSRLISFYINQ